MDTGSPLDDKVFVDKGIYNVAFAVHRDALGSRWHYVSLPVTLGLGRDAEMTAVRFDGDAPDWQQAWTDVTLFYPGQVSWPHLNSVQACRRREHQEGRAGQIPPQRNPARPLWRRGGVRRCDPPAVAAHPARRCAPDRRLRRRSQPAPKRRQGV